MAAFDFEGFDPIYGTPYDGAFDFRPSWDKTLETYQSPYRAAIEDKKAELRDRVSVMELLAGSVDQMQQIGYGAAELTGELAGSQSITDWGREGRQAESRELAPLHKRMAPFPGWKNLASRGTLTNPEFTQWLGEQALLQGPLMAPIAAAGFAAPAVGVPAAVGAGAIGIGMGLGETQVSAKEKAEQAGTKTNPLLVGAFGTFSGILDSIVPGRWAGKLANKFGIDVAEDIAMKTVNKAKQRGLLAATRRGVKGALRSGRDEAITEVLQETIAQEIGGSIASDTPIQWEQLPDIALQSAILGGALGGTMGGTVEALPERKGAFEDGGVTIDTDAIRKGRMAPEGPAAPDFGGRLAALRALTGPGGTEGAIELPPPPSGPSEPPGPPSDRLLPTPPPTQTTPAGGIDAVRATLLDLQEREAARGMVNPDPSPAQIEADNYKKAPIKWPGLPEGRIETVQGGVRKGVDKDGKGWRVKMPVDYGHLLGTKGADGDPVDAYFGPNKQAEKAFVIDQVDADTRKFDEHKVMLGFENEEQALETYRQAFSDGRGQERVGKVTPMPMPELKGWLEKPKRGAALPKAALGRPVTAMLKKAGGVEPGSPLAGELRAMDITPKTAPGLFKKGGLTAVDNFVAAETDLFRDQGDAQGYVPPETIMDGLRDEYAGRPLRTEEERQTEEAMLEEDEIKARVADIETAGHKVRKDERRRAAQLHSEGLDADSIIERLALDDLERYDPETIELEEIGNAFERSSAREGGSEAARQSRKSQADADTAAPSASGRGEVRGARREGEQPGAGQEGDQSVIPGAERVSDRELAQRKANEKLRAKKAQEGHESLGGLFGDDKKQGSLFESSKGYEIAHKDHGGSGRHTFRATANGKHIATLQIERGRAENTYVVPSWRRKGVMGDMIRHAEGVLGKKVNPSDELTYDGWKFWKGFRPEALKADRNYVPIDNPKAMEALEAQAKKQTAEDAKHEQDSEKKNLSERIPQTETAAFKRWFEGSKVVDANGDPLVVYHGAVAKFDEFDTQGFEGGSFFTASKRVAQKFSKWMQESVGGRRRTYSVYLSIKNPKTVQPSEVMRDGSHSMEAMSDAIKQARKEGYDGLYIPNTPDMDAVADQWVAFNPEQIKSATGNRGTFDPNDPSILAEKVKGKPGVNLQRFVPMVGMSLYGTPDRLPQVAVKELFQNSFDALKGAIERGKVKKADARIDIHVDPYERKIWIVDNGSGMATKTLATTFLEVAGTLKETDRASGGFGIAKMLFLFENQKIRIHTLRDGVLSELETTGPELKDAIMSGQSVDVEVNKGIDSMEAVVAAFMEGDNASFSLRAPQAERYSDSKSGTIVEITVPENYVDPVNGETKDIYMPLGVENYESLGSSPLFTDILVTYNGVELPIGRALPKREFSPFADVKFGWGTARIYIGPKKKESWKDGLHVLSNGLWQFDKRMPVDPLKPYGEQLPDDIYIDINPIAKPEEGGYPFDLNRQGFKKQAWDDLEAIMNYLSLSYKADNLSDQAAAFGEAHYVNPDGTIEAVNLTPAQPMKPRIPKGIKKGDKVEVTDDGRLLVNGQEVPVITSDKLQEAAQKAIDVDSLHLPEGSFDPNRIIIHDNTRVVGGKAGKVGTQVAKAVQTGLSPLTETPLLPLLENSISGMARARFGKRFDKFMWGIGRQFDILRKMVAKELGYDKLLKEAIGISFDEQYRGVSTRVPMSGSFVNPSATEYGDIERAAYGIIGTMIHELGHHKIRSEEHAPEMQRILIAMNTAKGWDYRAWEQKVVDLFKENADIFEYLHGIQANAVIQPRGRSFEGSREEQAEDAGAPGSLGRGREEGRSGYDRVPEAQGRARQEQDRALVPKGRKRSIAVDNYRSAVRSAIDGSRETIQHPILGKVSLMPGVGKGRARGDFGIAHVVEKRGRRFAEIVVPEVLAHGKIGEPYTRGGQVRQNIRYRGFEVVIQTTMDGKPSRPWVVTAFKSFRPEPRVIKIGDRVGIVKPQRKEMYAFEPVHGLYSPLQRGLENMQMKKGNPDKWRAEVRKLPNVRQAQLDWVGVDAWLDRKAEQLQGVSEKTHEIVEREARTKGWTVERGQFELEGPREPVTVKDENGGVVYHTDYEKGHPDERIIENAERFRFGSASERRFELRRKGQNDPEPVAEFETREDAEMALQGLISKTELLSFVEQNDIKLTELFRTENPNIRAIPEIVNPDEYRALPVPFKETGNDVDEDEDVDESDIDWETDYDAMNEEWYPTMDDGEIVEPDSDWLYQRASERLADDHDDLLKYINKGAQDDDGDDLEIEFAGQRIYNPRDLTWTWGKDTTLDGETFKEGDEVPERIKNSLLNDALDRAYEQETERYYEDGESPRQYRVTPANRNDPVEYVEESYGEWYWDGNHYRNRERVLDAIYEHWQEREIDLSDFDIHPETGQTREEWRNDEEREAPRRLAERGPRRHPRPNMGYKTYTEEGGTDYFELHLAIEPRVGQSGFHGGHFGHDVPNGFVWVRGKVRKDAEGRSILFIEEVQSDWWKEGQEQGWRRPLTDEEELLAENLKAQAKAKEEEAAKVKAKTEEMASDLARAVLALGFEEKWKEGYRERYGRNETTESEIADIGPWSDEGGINRLAMAISDMAQGVHRSNIINGTVQELMATRADALEELNGLHREEAKLIAEASNLEDEVRRIARRAESGASDMPYKDDWHEPVIKRMLRYAVDHGHAAVAWTPASMQIDRWNQGMRANVESIGWSPNIPKQELWTRKDADNALMRAAAHNDHRAVRAIEDLIELSPGRASFPADVAGRDATEALRRYAMPNADVDAAPDGKIQVVARRTKNAGEIVLLVDPEQEVEVNKKDKKGNATGEKIKIKPGVIVSSQGVSGLNGKTLAQVLGNKIAKQILTEPAGKLEGDTLSVGGQGYQSMYNQKLTAQLNSWGAPFMPQPPVPRGPDGKPIRGAKPEKPKDAVELILLPDFIKTVSETAKWVPTPEATNEKIMDLLKLWAASDYVVADFSNLAKTVLAEQNNFEATPSDWASFLNSHAIGGHQYYHIWTQSGLFTTEMEKEVKGTKVPTIYVTEAMKESILKGLPFSLGTKKHRIKPKASDDWAALAETVRKVIADMAPNVRLELGKRMRAKGRDISGKFSSEVQTIYVALAGSDPKKAARHEVIHALRQLGYISPKEWETLVRAAIKENWSERYDIWANYGQIYNSMWGPDEAAERLLEEAVAHHFAEWQKGAKVGGPIAAIFRAIRDFIRRISNALAKRGFQTFDDVFESIETGKVGRRDPVDAWKPIEEGGELYSLADLKREAIEGYKSLDQDWRSAIIQGNYGQAAGKAWSRIQYLQQDVFLPIKQAIERAQAHGASIVDDLNPYLKEEMYHKRVAEKIERLDRDFLEPILKLMNDAGISEEEADLFLMARHAEERNAHIASINAAFPDSGSGMSDTDARDTLRGFTGPKRVALDQIGALIDQMHAWKLDFMQAEGVLNARGANELRSRWKHYVPLKDLDVPEGLWAAKGIGPTLNVKGKPFKKALGRATRADGILANSIADMKDAMVRAEKNRVMRAFYDFAKAFPQPDLYEADAVKFKRVLVKRGPYMGSTLFVPAHLSAAPDIERYIRDPLGEMGRGYVHLMVDGEKRVVKVNNPLIQDALEKTRQGIEGWTTISAANRLLARVLISWNPAFFIPNFARDVQAAGLRMAATDGTKAARKIMGGAFKAARGIAAVEFNRGSGGQWGALYRELAEVGGLTGFSDLVRDPVAMQARIERKLRAMRGDLRYWERPSHMVETFDEFFEPFNAIFENASRVSAYKWGLDQGMTKEQAASLAKNITLNFNRKGASQTLRTLFLFANPAVQGSAVFLKAATSKHGWKMLAGMYAAGAVMALVNAIMGAAMGDDEDKNAYLAIDDYARNNNLIIMNPYYLFFPAEKGVDKRTFDHFSIPLPYTFSLPYQLGRRSMETIISKVSDEFEKPPTMAEQGKAIMHDTFGAFSPVGTHPNPMVWITPSIAKPFAEMYVNKNFTGREIQPRFVQEEKPKFAQHQKHTGFLATEISKGLNWLTGGDNYTPGWIDVPPDFIEHTFNAYSGEWGRMLMKGYDLATTSMRVATDQWDYRDVELKGQDVPVLRRFWASDTGSAYTADYYDIKNDMERAKTAKKQKGDADAKQWLAEHPVHEKLLGQYERTEKELRELNKKHKALLANEKLDQAKKDLKERDIYDLKQVTYRRFLMEYYAKTRIDAIERSDESPANKAKMKELVNERRNTGMRNLGLIEREIKGTQAPQGRPPEGTEEALRRLMERYNRTVLPPLRNY